MFSDYGDGFLLRVQSDPFCSKLSSNRLGPTWPDQLTNHSVALWDRRGGSWSQRDEKTQHPHGAVPSCTAAASGEAEPKPRADPSASGTKHQTETVKAGSATAAGRQEVGRK